MCDRLAMQCFKNGLKNMFSDPNVDDYAVPAFYDICKSIGTYTTADVRDVLRFFRAHPVQPSEARWRVQWCVEKIQAYCVRILFQRSGGVLPTDIDDDIAALSQSFPRPNHKQDNKMADKNQYLGYCVRTHDRNGSLMTGIVEKVIVLGPMERKYHVVFHDETQRTQKKKVTERFEIWTEADVESNLYQITFGLLGCLTTVSEIRLL